MHCVVVYYIIKLEQRKYNKYKALDAQEDNTMTNMLTELKEWGEVILETLWFMTKCFLVVAGFILLIAFVAQVVDSVKGEDDTVAFETVEQEQAPEVNEVALSIIEELEAAGIEVEVEIVEDTTNTNFSKEFTKIPVH